MPREAKDLVDQLIMEVGRETGPRDIRNLLGMTGTSTSSHSGPSTSSQGSMSCEVEALRRRLNDHFKGTKDDLGLWMEVQPKVR